MKGIKKTWMAGVLACATFNVHAEVSPLGYGIKGGIGTSSAVGYSDEAKISGKKAQGSFFDTLAGFGHLHGEYAFTDYIGLGLEAGYMRQGASLTAEDEKKEEKEGDTSNNNNNSISITSHGIGAGLYLYIYPLGREEEEGILKIMVGGSPYFPLKTTYKKGGKELTLTEDQKKQKAVFDIAVTGGIAYELPFGLSIEAKYSYGLMNRFKTENDKDQIIFTDSSASTTGLKNLHMQNATVGIGYNFAALLSE